jgi:hypothetical protein
MPLNREEITGEIKAHIHKFGGAPGVPTTGDIHLDTVNPYPSWSVAFGPGGFALTALAHGVFDVFGGGLYPGSQACQ